MVSYLTRHGIYALAMGDEAMQMLNLEAVRNRQAAPWASQPVRSFTRHATLSLVAGTGSTIRPATI